MNQRYDFQGGVLVSKIFLESVRSGNTFSFRTFPSENHFYAQSSHIHQISTMEPPNKRPTRKQPAIKSLTKTYTSSKNQVSRLTMGNNNSTTVDQQQFESGVRGYATRSRSNKEKNGPAQQHVIGDTTNPMQPQQNLTVTPKRRSSRRNKGQESMVQPEKTSKEDPKTRSTQEIDPLFQKKKKLIPAFGLSVLLVKL